MLGEFLREAAVLVAVFTPLDALNADELTVRTIVGTVVLSGGLLGCGILLDPGPTSSER
jgi:hypothetical protein